MQRPTAGMNATNEYGIEMSEYNSDPSMIEGGSNSTEGVFNTTVLEVKDTRTFFSELAKTKVMFTDIATKGFGHYWAMQSRASKISHGIFGFVSTILSLNFVMAMIAHFSWDRAHLGHHLAEDEVMILYCQTQGCGCENGVLQRCRKLIMDHLAGDEGNEKLKVYTELYPGAPLIQFFSRFFQMIQLFLLITIFFGPMICRKIYGYGADVADKAQIQYPYFVQKLAVGGCLKKLGMFVLVFIGFNIIVALMTLTGAFEIYHGSDIVFSSLESQRMVTPRDLIDAFPRLDGQESPLMSMEKLDTPVGHMH